MKPVWGAVVALALCAVVVTACGGAANTGTGGTSTSSPGIGPTSTPGAVASLGGGATAPPAGSAVDACSLLSDEEIAATTGYPVKSKTAGPVMGIFSNGCTWEVDSAAQEIVDWSIDVGVITPGGRRYYDTFLAIGDDVEPITGLGDIAQKESAGGISAVKGDTLVSVFLIAMGADNEDEMTRQLTQTALSHL